MNRSHFFDLVKHPDKLDKETLPSLTDIVTEYPWFQAGRILLVKNLHMLDHVRYNSELKLAAAHISDRARLFDLIHKPAEKIEETIEVDQSAESLISDQAARLVDAAPIHEVAVSGAEAEIASDQSPLSSIEVSTKVKSVSNYFQSTDVYQTADGSSVDFSTPIPPAKAEEITFSANEQKLTNEAFLDYETSETSSYQLAESRAYHEVTGENRSFSDWLNMLQHVPIHQEDKQEEKPVPKRSQQIIDNFLSMERPRIIPVEKREPEISSINDQVASATNDTDDLMSETLAGIYIKQKHYNKAISIFEKLRLKYPEKNTYFADQISELEKLIINNKK